MGIKRKIVGSYLRSFYLGRLLTLLLNFFYGSFKSSKIINLSCYQHLRFLSLLVAMPVAHADPKMQRGIEHRTHLRALLKHHVVLTCCLILRRFVIYIVCEAIYSVGSRFGFQNNCGCILILMCGIFAPICCFLQYLIVQLS